MEDIIIKNAQKGDKESFSSAILPLRTEAYRVAFCYLHNESDSMDAVFTGVEKALINIAKLKDTRFFKTWFIRIVINECKQQLRQRERLIYLSDNIERIDYKAIISEEKLDLDKLLLQLEPQDRLIIYLKYHMGYTLLEISRLMELPEGTVKTRLYTNLKWLKSNLVVKED